MTYPNHGALVRATCGLTMSHRSVFADALCDRCSSVSACSGGHNFVDGIRFLLVCKNMQ